MKKDPIDGANDGLWMATAQPAPLVQALTQSFVSDIAIASGGLTGLNAAMELSRCGMSGTVLEAASIHQRYRYQKKRFYHE